MGNVFTQLNLWYTLYIQTYKVVYNYINSIILNLVFLSIIKSFIITYNENNKKQ